MTDKETETRIMQMTTTLAHLDVIVQRFGPSMVEDELTAIGMAYRLIDGMRAELLIDTGAFTVDDFIQQAPESEEPEVAPALVDEPDPVLEKGRAALKAKPSKK